MSLESNLTLAFERVADEFKTLKTYVSGSGTGDVSALNTTATNLVGAINEILAASGAGNVTSVNGVSGPGAITIDTDDIGEGSTNLYYTNSRADARVQAAIGSTGSPSASTIASTQDVVTYVGTQIAAVVNSAPAALDTLIELASALGNDANFSTTVTTAIGNRLRLDAAGGYSGGQQLQGRQNLDVYSTTEIGSVTHDFVADFEAALL